MRILMTTAAIAALALAACEAEEPVAEAPVGEEMAEAPEPAPMDDAPMEEAMEEEEEVVEAYAIPAGTPANIARAVGSSERSPEMTVRDVNRKPAEILTMAGVEEGDTIVEFAGFGQYYTTMLAEAVGPDGQIYVYDLPYTDAFAGDPSREFAAAHDNVEYLQGEYDEMELPSDVDEAFIVLYYHDLHVSSNTVDVPAFNQKVFDALKPGGTYLVIDHNARPGSGMEDTDDLHRIDPEVIKEEVLAAGFELAEESDMLANPDDEHAIGPFDPSIRGLTDRTVFVFVKPEA